MIQKTLSGNPSSPMPQGSGVRVSVHAYAEVCKV